MYTANKSVEQTHMKVGKFKVLKWGSCDGSVQKELAEQI